MTQKYKEALSCCPTVQLSLPGEEPPTDLFVNKVITVSSAALGWRV